MKYVNAATIVSTLIALVIFLVFVMLFVRISVYTYDATAKGPKGIPGSVGKLTLGTGGEIKAS